MLNPSQTKNRIRGALLELMQEIDADKITAVNLAQKAGVSRATLYRYYGSVDEVLIEMEDEFLEGMRDCSRYYISAPFDTSHLDEPYPAFVAVGEYIYEHKDFYLSITGPHGDARFIERWHKFVREFYCGKLIYEGLSTKDLDVYIEFALGGNDASMRYWLEKRPDLSAEEIAPITQRLLYGPFV